MRLDKFLKVCRIIKRRTISKDLIQFGQVAINGKIAKPSTIVKIGDFITLTLGTKQIEIQVTSLECAHLSKENAYSMYKMISEKVISAS